MIINITAGQELKNKIKNDKEKFIAFNEAMIKGSFSYPLFSNGFIKERAEAHQVSEESYKETMKDFLEFTKELDKYNKVILWFGNEPFCRINTKTVLQFLKDKRFKGEVVLNIVDEITGDIEINTHIDLYHPVKEISITVMNKMEINNLVKEYENPIKHKCSLQVGQRFITKDGTKPIGMCSSAWMSVEPFVCVFLLGGYDLYDGWMKDKHTAMISCNDGFRPVSFLIKSV